MRKNIEYSHKLMIYDLVWSLIFGIVFTALIQCVFNYLLALFFKSYNLIYFFIPLSIWPFSPDSCFSTMGFGYIIICTVLGNLFTFSVVIFIYAFFQRYASVRYKTLFNFCRYLFCFGYVITVCATLYIGKPIDDSHVRSWCYTVVIISLLTYYFILPWAVFKYQAWAIERLQKHTQVMDE